MALHPLDTIRSHYHPIQPSVRCNDDQICYEEFEPSQDVKTYVYCYWQLKTKEHLTEPYAYRVVSDGCIDIFFEAERPEYSFIMGFCRKYTEFEIGQKFNYYGIRFMPSAFTLLFGIDAKTLSNRDLPLNLVQPRLATWLSALENVSHDSKSFVEQMNMRLATAINQAAIEFDHRFYDALYEILNAHGHIDVEQDLNTGLSPRQQRRIFNYYIGTTPKAFSNVVRFQYILNTKPSTQSLKQNKIYYDVGFFDQAHFIKSFKAFYGVTPAQAFR